MSDAKQAETIHFGTSGEATWYGELYVIHKLKVAAARMALLKHNTAEYQEALQACHDLGLTDEILLERLKV